MPQWTILGVGVGAISVSDEVTDHLRNRSELRAMEGGPELVQKLDEAGEGGYEPNKLEKELLVTAVSRALQNRSDGDGRAAREELIGIGRTLILA